jgi:acyl carrier protein
VLGSSPDKIDLAKPLTEVGLDSLMAVELRNWVEGELRVTIPIVELMQGPSVDRLADLLLEQLLKSDAPPPSAPAAPLPAVEAPAVPQPVAVAPNGAAEAPTVDAARAEEILARVDALSDAEVDALLGTMTAEKEQPR